MTIRTASPEDIPAIREIACVAFPATYRDILSAEQIEYMMEMMYSEESLTKQMTQQKNIFFLCEGKGYVSYRYDTRAEDGAEVFHIEKLYVLPSCRGEGLGRKLFNTAVRAALESTTCPEVRIQLNVNRNNKALGFYKHIGMSQVSQGDFPIGNGFYMNDFIMSEDFDR